MVGIEIEIRSTTFALLISVGMTSTLLVIPLGLLFGMLVIPKRVKRVECISVLSATALGSLAQGRQFQAPLCQGAGGYDPPLRIRNAELQRSVASSLFYR